MIKAQRIKRKPAKGRNPDQHETGRHARRAELCLMFGRANTSRQWVKLRKQLRGGLNAGR